MTRTGQFIAGGIIAALVTLSHFLAYKAGESAVSLKATAERTAQTVYGSHRDVPRGPFAGTSPAYRPSYWSQYLSARQHRSERHKANVEAAASLRLMGGMTPKKPAAPEHYRLEWVPWYWSPLPGQLPTIEVAPNTYAPAHTADPSLRLTGIRPPKDPNSLGEKKAILVKE